MPYCNRFPYRVSEYFITHNYLIFFTIPNKMKRLNFVKYDLYNSKENAIKNNRTKETFTTYFHNRNGLNLCKKNDWILIGKINKTISDVDVPVGFKTALFTQLEQRYLTSAQMHRYSSLYSRELGSVEIKGWENICFFFLNTYILSIQIVYT